MDETKAVTTGLITGGALAGYYLSQAYSAVLQFRSLQ